MTSKRGRMLLETFETRALAFRRKLCARVCHFGFRERLPSSAQEIVEVFAAVVKLPLERRPTTATPSQSILRAAGFTGPSCSPGDFRPSSTEFCQPAT
ncbi:hypothetical protein MRX96_019038 [Rhipicephalus microplus]